MGKISQLPISKRRRAKMDAHNRAQALYRDKHRSARIPDREDFGVAALTVILLMVDCDPTDPRHIAMRKGVAGELARAGFDHAASLRRFDEMAERIHQLRNTRQWRRECEAQLREAKSVSADK